MNVLDETVTEALRRWRWGTLATELSGTGEETAVSAPELLEGIEGTARVLRRAGVREGVLVALFLENSVDFLLILFALFRLRAVAVIGKVEYRFLELREIFANADPPVVIAEKGATPTLSPFLSGRLVLERGERGLSIGQAGTDAPERAPFDGSLASINYTYRGLGYPLGAMITPEQYLHGARVLQEGLQGEEGDPMLFAIPMTHIFTLVGCLLVPILYGMPMVVARTLHPRRTFDAIERLGVCHITAVPELYRLLLRTRDPDRPLPTLKSFVSGGSYLGSEEYHALRDAFDIEVLHGYGLTEFTPVSRNSRGDSRPGTVGPICDGVECQVDGDSSGEIVLRTETMRAEYYRRPRESRDAYREGWFRSGDAGHFAEGHLVFDREIKRTCKVNGLLVDLVEVEGALAAMPGVRSVEASFVDGAVTARIETGRSETDRELTGWVRDFLSDRLAAYKIPKSVTSKT
ncbi:MAG: class I adenylate-forming enzyme family protein [Spirochaetaceae bacterium]